jgi:hypothetical protein
MHLSDAMKSMPRESTPTQISKEVGGAFALFGGHIGGRQFELVPNERMVQAWRVLGWPPGAYSIATFHLVEQGGGAGSFLIIRPSQRLGGTPGRWMESSLLGASPEASRLAVRYQLH